MNLTLNVSPQIGRENVVALLEQADIQFDLHDHSNMLWVNGDTPVVPLLKVLTRAGLRVRAESWNELHVVEGHRAQGHLKQTA